MTPGRAQYLVTALTVAVFMATGHSQHVDVFLLVVLIAVWLIAISRPATRGRKISTKLPATVELQGNGTIGRRGERRAMRRTGA